MIATPYTCALPLYLYSVCVIVTLTQMRFTCVGTVAISGGGPALPPDWKNTIRIHHAYPCGIGKSLPRGWIF